jgi:hypothetical protein
MFRRELLGMAVAGAAISIKSPAKAETIEESVDRLACLLSATHGGAWEAKFDPENEFVLILRKRLPVSTG